MLYASLRAIHHYAQAPQALSQNSNRSERFSLSFPLEGAGSDSAAPEKTLYDLCESLFAHRARWSMKVLLYSLVRIVSVSQRPSRVLYFL